MTAGSYQKIVKSIPAKAKKDKFIYLCITLGHNLALTHQNMSYRDSETMGKVEAQKRKQRGGNERKRTATTKNK